MDFTGVLILPLGLGLLGFIEPCTLGSSLLFVNYLEGKAAPTKVLHTVVFAVTRALFIGSLGALAALVGGSFIAVQQWFWVVLGSAYVVLGGVYLAGAQRRLVRLFGAPLGVLSSNRSAAALGVVFGLNIPACAAPLLAAVFAASFGAAGVLRGFWLMAVFGLALSLPLVAAVSSRRTRAMLDSVARAAHRQPFWAGTVLILLGLWSVYLGVTA